ncbi:NCS1 family nucleobase:cation symporter-1 [Flavonifractor plautii]|uniref:NCS1 family nucleobase:cation symporter-1 n=1 Tax=Flavonifractor plautii TaxID=292800 RepID=UPI001FAA722A|nr:NCS1 family nucleobase:cation symporter-1 [Flavonifractor plautii]MDB7924530.1 NCS1 family nucleobase:cation symporter-1 [Flavonifractor plautii]MDC0818653.1 NCS1 family nucleobase:cation symporter-1 [Flavonifractor plautii]UYJ52825.1 MAG: NCS1 family nucleobase:cation symporter-1 [Flavonifractor plautii]
MSGREWSTKNYITLWTGILVSIPVYMMASALLSAGLTWYQALFICVLGHTLVLIPSILLGKFGSRYGASFPVLSKMVFGPKGTAIPTIIRAFMGCLWFGIQNWIGGTALDAIIAVIFPAYTGLAFHSFLSFGLFVLINFYIGYHGSRAIRFLEDFAAPILIILSGVVIVWAFWLASQKGGFAALFTTQVAGGNGESFWSQFFPSLTSMIAFDATIALNFSDYTRHAKTEGAQVKGQLIGAPIMTAFIVFVGICGTSGSELAFGEAFWDPSILVSHFGNPAVVIIFSLFIILATLTTNVACNLAAASVVFSSLFGKVLTYKKAVVVATILSICFLPWKLVENPESYVYTLNGTLAVFLGPITGICLAALWSQYRNRLRLPDLYYQDGGAYYYQGGWNVLALVTMAVLFIFIFVCQFIPVLKWIYDSSYLLGCVFAFVIYSALCKRQDR